jgi:hypothetical protein
MLMTLVETGERRPVLQVMADEVTSWTGLLVLGARTPTTVRDGVLVEMESWIWDRRFGLGDVT